MPESNPSASPARRPRSGGPRTAEGRARSSMNALKHGLSAKTLLFPNESSVQFAEILDAYHDCLRPQNQVEAGLVAQLAAARWRLRRVWRYETAVLDLEMDAAASE